VASLVTATRSKSKLRLRMELEGLGGTAVRFENEICNELQCRVLLDWGTKPPEQMGHAGAWRADVAKRSPRSVDSEYRVATNATPDLPTRSRVYEDFD